MSGDWKESVAGSSASPGSRAAYAEACDKRQDWIVFQRQLIAADKHRELPRNRARVAAMQGRAGRMRPRKYRLP